MIIKKIDIDALVCVYVYIFIYDEHVHHIIVLDLIEELFILFLSYLYKFWPDVSSDLKED